MNESKATRYQRSRRRSVVWSTVLAAALLVVAALSDGQTGWAGTAMRARRWWPAGGPAISLAVYVLGLALVWQILRGASSRLLGAEAPSAPDTGSDGLGRAFASALREMLAAFVVAFVCGAAVSLAAAVAGTWWWALAGVAAAGALVAAMHLGPAMIARSSGARPIQRPSLVEALGALARQVRVPIASIDELPASASVTAAALVAGAGGARRVFIAHELMRDWSDDEIAVVVAHEFAHHAHRDLWRTLVLDVSVLAGGLWLSAAALRATGVAPDGVPATLPALPAIALVAGGVWVATTPLRHALSRRQERAADLFALTLTGKANVFQTAIRRLAARHLAEERPSPFTRWFFHRHPTPEERLQLSDDFGRRAR